MQFRSRIVAILSLPNQLVLFEMPLWQSMDLELALVSPLPYQLDMVVQCTDSLAALELLQLADNKFVQTATVDMLERVEQTALPGSVEFQKPVAFAESADCLPVDTEPSVEDRLSEGD